MVARPIMDSNMCRQSFLSETNCHNQSQFQLDVEDPLICNDGNHKSLLVRSVAMSANIASTVRNEVNHLIRVDSLASDIDQLSFKANGTIQPPPYVNMASASCSHILPMQNENIVTGIILSKWDDIMGPQTIHSWLETNSIEMEKTGKNEVPTVCFHEANAFLMEAIKYVTGHTVNYMGVSTVSAEVLAEHTFNERSSSLFIVPDLNLIAQSVVFNLPDRDLHVPYSLVLIVDYRHYECYLKLRNICLLWLRRISSRMQQLLLSCVQINKEFVTSEEVDSWIYEFNLMLISLTTSGLGLAYQTLTYDKKNILQYPFIESALISHLQTFGCTVVMGNSYHDINALIEFLALFLETDELFCSRFVLPSQKNSFHMGLFLQGLLLDEFGGRKLCSQELTANPYPVTAIDLTRGATIGAVKQSSFRQSGLPSRHQSMFCSVNDSSSKLVAGLLADFKMLPMHRWQKMTQLFKEKVKALSQTLLNLVYGNDNMGFSGRKGVELQKHLSSSMDLGEADFFIVLTAAEKLSPGIFYDILNFNPKSS